MPIVVLTALLAALLIPLLLATHIPLKFDWLLYIRFYLVRGTEALAIAGALLASTMSRSELSVALKQRGSWEGLARLILAIIIPAVYLFSGLVIVFGYNDVIASIRFYALYDHVAAAADSWLLGGSNVSAIAHRILGLQPAFGSSATIVYGCFYQLIGAVLIFLSVKVGLRRAIELVNTLMVQYYLALIIFLLFPVQGPFYSSPQKSLGLEYAEQSMLLQQANQAWHHTKTIISFDYFIGFPSLHVGLIVVTLWFLREWRVPRIVLALYLILVIPSVLLVEWHYLVDVIGGLAVAAASITITRLVSGIRSRERAASGEYNVSREVIQ